MASSARLIAEGVGHRRLLALAALWLFFALALGFWWNRLAVSLAGRVSDLEARLGITSSEHLSEARMLRMLNLESGAFLVFFLAFTLVLLILNWKFVKRSQGLQRFFTGVTHELRTPLTSIRLQAESICGARAASSEVVELGRRLLEDCLRLESQVDRTLDLAALEGGSSIHLTSLDLKRLIERALQPWLQTFGSRLTFELDSSLDGIQIEADPSAVRTIFRNLIDNSFRHTPSDSPCRIWISATATSTGVTVQLRDSGTETARFPPGSTPGELFVRGQKSQGTGVGLYLVQSLMRQMGGSVNFDLSPGFPVQLQFNRAREDQK